MNNNISYDDALEASQQIFGINNEDFGGIWSPGLGEDFSVKDIYTGIYSQDKSPTIKVTTETKTKIDSMVIGFLK